MTNKKFALITIVIPDGYTNEAIRDVVTKSLPASWGIRVNDIEDGRWLQAALAETEG